MQIKDSNLALVNIILVTTVDTTRCPAVVVALSGKSQLAILQVNIHMIIMIIITTE